MLKTSKHTQHAASKCVYWSFCCADMGAWHSHTYMQPYIVFYSGRGTCNSQQYVWVIGSCPTFSAPHDLLFGINFLHIHFVYRAHKVWIMLAHLLFAFLHKLPRCIEGIYSLAILSVAFPMKILCLENTVDCLPFIEIKFYMCYVKYTCKICLLRFCLVILNHSLATYRSIKWFISYFQKYVAKYKDEQVHKSC